MDRGNLPIERQREDRNREKVPDIRQQMVRRPIPNQKPVKMLPLHGSERHQGSMKNLGKRDLQNRFKSAKDLYDSEDDEENSLEDFIVSDDSDAQMIR